MSERFSRVVVPVDASPDAIAASRHGALLAGLLGAELRLLHVMAPLPADFSDLPGNRTTTTDTDRAGRREAAAKTLAAAREVAESTGLTEIREELMEDPALSGNPATTIIDQAQADTGGLIVIGSRGLDDLHKLVLDSTSHTVIHRASVPVTVVHEGTEEALEHIGHIILPVDGSRHSAKAAELAGDLARAAGATVDLLHSVPRIGRPVDDPEPETVFADARQHLGEGIASVAERRITADHPATAILDYLADAPASSIVIMGRRGLGHVREHLLGSVSHRVLERARCPVTVVT